MNWQPLTPQTAPPPKRRLQDRDVVPGNHQPEFLSETAMQSLPCRSLADYPEGAELPELRSAPGSSLSAKDR